MRHTIVPAAATFVGLVVALALFRPWASSSDTVRRIRPVAQPDPAGRPSTAPRVIQTKHARIRIVSLTHALVEPWAMAFLPDGDILVTERRGRLQRIQAGRLAIESVGGMPPVDTRKQDGLMDLALHPRFADNRTIYFTYSKSGEGGDTTALASAIYDGVGLTAVRDVFVADAWSTEGGNSGSRIAFSRDGTIYMTVGDRHEQMPAQSLRSHKGKILRLNDDGTVPPDNPFVDRVDARHEIFAYGVRNPQGLFVDPSTGTLWENEHGPRGGDELNIIVRGHNYGWPVITFGTNYDGSTISKITARAGMDQPVVHWTPSIAPSGLTVYSGHSFPEWRGHLFLGALGGLNLRRIELKDGGDVAHEEVLQVTTGRQRIRDVRQGPDGLLYVLTESGALLRMEAAP
jgi:aldose sugar dehydrogenase